MKLDQHPLEAEHTDEVEMEDVFGIPAMSQAAKAEWLAAGSVNELVRRPDTVHWQSSQRCPALENLKEESLADSHGAYID